MNSRMQHTVALATTHHRVDSRAPRHTAWSSRAKKCSVALTQKIHGGQFRVKNFWGKGDAYQGLNSVYKIEVDGETLFFELQFHVR
jgi:hypothetical protein